MSVRVTLNCQVKSGQFETLLPFLEENLPNVRGFKGNLRVSVLFNDATNEMLLDEEWLSVECHQRYLKFIDENGVLGELGALLEAAPTIQYFKTVEV